MSIIKAVGASGRFQIFAAAHQNSDTVEVGPLAAAREEITDLRRQLAEADDIGKRAIEIARWEGITEGKRQADAQMDRRSQLLTDALDRAEKAWTARLESVEQLAVDLAQRAVRKVIGCDVQRSTLVQAAIVERLRSVRPESVIAIRLNPKDLEPSLPEFAVFASRVSQDPDIASGCGRIDLEVGQIDAGVLDQLNALDLVWKAMAQ